MRLYQVDAFTDTIFKGNPAGVCILASSEIENEEFLQNIAAEMNLSETAFLYKENAEYRLRWFTPEIEVSLCGHATLSAAHILWETGLENQQDVIKFNTLSGTLWARHLGNKIEMDFPRYEVTQLPEQKDVNLALGIEPVFTGTDGEKLLMEVANLQILKNIRPDFIRLKELGTAFITTCKANNSEYDFYSRFFAPGVGINEDPVTGSSHSTLAPYWSKKLGKRKIIGYQASKRGGVIECELPDSGRVLIRGQARTVFEIVMKEFSN